MEAARRQTREKALAVHSTRGSIGDPPFKFGEVDETLAKIAELL
jgi:hypothetical protein